MKAIYGIDGDELMIIDGDMIYGNSWGLIEKRLLNIVLNKRIQELNSD